MQSHQSTLALTPTLALTLTLALTRVARCSAILRRRGASYRARPPPAGGMPSPHTTRRWPNPHPNPSPSPSPNPTPNPDPNPTPDPNPEPTPTPKQVAVLQQTIDDQSQQIKALEAAVEALRNLVCIMAGLVVVIL